MNSTKKRNLIVLVKMQQNDAVLKSHVHVHVLRLKYVFMVYVRTRTVHHIDLEAGFQSTLLKLVWE